MKDHLPAPSAPSPEALRHNGWTAARQQCFLDTLADTGSVAMACRRVGMSRTAAYRLRRHPDAGDFRAAWDLALAEAFRQIEHVALERALHGEEEVIERDGMTEVVRRRPCDARLLVRLLDRADAWAASQALIARQMAELRDLINHQPDRRDWLPEAPAAQDFAAVERLPAPMVLLQPESCGLWQRAGRARVKPDV